MVVRCRYEFVLPSEKGLSPVHARLLTAIGVGYLLDVSAFISTALVTANDASTHPQNLSRKVLVICNAAMAVPLIAELGIESRVGHTTVARLWWLRLVAAHKV